MIDGFWYGLALGAFIGVGLMMTLFRWGVKRIRTEYEKIIRGLEEKLNPPITVHLGVDTSRASLQIRDAMERLRSPQRVQAAHELTDARWFWSLAALIHSKHAGRVEIHQADLLDLPQDIVIEEYRDYETAMHVLRTRRADPGAIPTRVGESEFLQVGTTNGEPPEDRGPVPWDQSGVGAQARALGEAARYRTQEELYRALGVNIPNQDGVDRDFRMEGDTRILPTGEISVHIPDAHPTGNIGDTRIVGGNQEDGVIDFPEEEDRNG